MAKAFTPKVLTANHLLKGDVIYMGLDGCWTRDHSLAQLYSDEGSANSALKVAERHQEFLVGAYLADAVSNISGSPQPVHYKEKFRATGPSNYAHGKQVEL